MTRADDEPSRSREDRAPEGPTDLKREAWGGGLKRTAAGVREDNLTVWGAPLINNPASVASGPAKQIITSALQNLQSGRGGAGALFIVSLAAALWAASGYVAAFMQGSNVIYDVGEGRPIWKTLPTRLLTTLVLLLLLAVAAVGVTFTGGLATQAGKLLGVGSSAVTIWDIAKWPVILATVLTMLSILYWASPNVKHPRFRWVSAGGILGVVVWLLASAAFALYVANFASYNKTYGAFGGVIVFLVWLWISNIAILLGAEFNAELERGRQIHAGHPAKDEPFLEPRDTRKL